METFRCLIFKAQNLSASVAVDEETGFKVDDESYEADQSLCRPVPMVIESVILSGWNKLRQLLVEPLTFDEYRSSFETSFADICETYVDDLECCCCFLWLCVNQSAENNVVKVDLQWNTSRKYLTWRFHEFSREFRFLLQDVHWTFETCPSLYSLMMFLTWVRSYFLSNYEF